MGRALTLGGLVGRLLSSVEQCQKPQTSSPQLGAMPCRVLRVQSHMTVLRACSLGPQREKDGDASPCVCEM